MKKLRSDAIRRAYGRGDDDALRRARRHPKAMVALAAWLSFPCAACYATGPEPDAAPWHLGLRSGFGASTGSELAVGYDVSPNVALGGLVRERVLLGAVFANSFAMLSGGEEVDVDLFEVAAQARLSPIPTGGTRPWLDLLAGWSHADSVRGSPSADGPLWGVEIGVSQYVSDRVALELGVGFARVDLDRGFGTEDAAEVQFGVLIRF
ncbi:MAG: hypothetical protein AB7O97_05370 [Planctomycetota bacterium]